MGNRDLARRDLKNIRNDWFIPIILTDPEGVVYDKIKGTEDQLLGDVRRESFSYDPETGEAMVVPEAVIPILIDDLERVPKENEKWIIQFASDLLPGGTLVKYAVTPNSSIVSGATQGFIKLRVTDLKQV